MENILKLTQINKSFPGVKALSDVNLTVRKGEVHALVGENGAGKSTLMKIISGAYKKDSGTVWFDGQEVENTTPKQSEMMGISIIYQELNLIERITVAENVFIGRYPMKHGMVQWKEMFQQAQALFDEYELKINAKSLVRSLTMAQKQMVEIIKAVSINAKIIIMDEPTSSLSGKETESLFKIIRKLKSRGVAIVFITHRLDEIFEICDRMTVLRDGCYIGERNICDITKDEMIAMMIGRKLTQQYPERSNPIGEVTLEVKNIIDHNSRVKGISFQAHRGEVLGFYGLVGAGRTETMRMIFGVDPVVGGEIYIHGKQRRIRSPRDAIAAGMGFVTVERSFDLPGGLAEIDPNGTVLFDSVTACLAAQMFDGGGMDMGAPRRAAEQIAAISRVPAHFVCVCDGIWQGGEDYDPWTAAYTAGLAGICRTLAAEFDVVCEMTMGLPHVWKGEMPRA